jgi:hypothetical protein
MRSLLRTASLIIVALAAFERSASAFCRTTTCDPNAGDECRRNATGCIRDGVPLKWKTSPIVYRFYGEGSAKLDDGKMRAAVRRAFNEWSEVECADGRTTLRFEEGEDVTEDKPLNVKEAPEKFGIYFRDDEWPHQNSEDSLALTNQIYGKVTGTIDYADIEINTAATKFALSDAEDGPDFQAVITHEVGHYIGLAHSTVEDSIMVPRYCENKERCGKSVDQSRQLAEDDKRAVCAAYEPEVKRFADPPTTCSSTSGKSSSPSIPATTLGIGFLAFSILRKRSRRTRPW